jgi:hypothetical protein
VNGEILCGNRAEAYKGAVHMLLFGIASVCAAYNCGEAVVRPTRRSAAQAVLYGLMAAHEAHQTRCHWMGK